MQPILVMFSFIAAVGLVGTGVAKQSPLRVAGGIGAVVVVLVGCRVLPGAESVNGIGTGLFGEVDTPDGVVMTKWVRLFLPLVPVRSYYVLHAGERVGTVFSQERSYRLAPLPGLGLHWESVAGTALLSLVGAACIAIGIALFVSECSPPPGPGR